MIMTSETSFKTTRFIWTASGVIEIISFIYLVKRDFCIQQLKIAAVLVEKCLAPYRPNVYFEYNKNENSKYQKTAINKWKKVCKSITEYLKVYKLNWLIGTKNKKFNEKSPNEWLCVSEWESEKCR